MKSVVGPVSLARHAATTITSQAGIRRAAYAETELHLIMLLYGPEGKWFTG
jgi:hypothetical protein